MLETADRLVAEEREPAVQQFLLLVGGLRAMTGRRARAPARSSTPTCCARSPWPATRRRSSHCARCGGEGPHRWFNPSAGGVLCPTAGCPARPHPAPETARRARRAARRRLGGRRGRRPAVAARGGRARGGVPAVAPRARAAVAGVRRALTPSRRQPAERVGPPGAGGSARRVSRWPAVAETGAQAAREARRPPADPAPLRRPAAGDPDGPGARGTSRS